VQGPVALEHDVVGDVDHVVDRPHAGEGQPLREPRGRRPDRDLHRAAHEAGAADRVLDVDGEARRGVALVAGRRRLGNREREAEVGREVAGDADDAHRVRPVGGDREIEDDVVQAEDPAHVGAEHGAGIQRQDAGVVLPQAQLLGGTEHAVGDLAPDLAALEREPARQRGPGRGERHDHARGDVGRATHDARLPRAEVDVRELELVGVGVRQDGEDPRGDDAGDVAPGLIDRLDLEPEVRERVGDLGDRGVEGREVADPGERSPHAGTFP
jgi:hypothetical protein